MTLVTDERQRLLLALEHATPVLAATKDLADVAPAWPALFSAACAYAKIDEARVSTADLQDMFNEIAEGHRLQAVTSHWETDAFAALAAAMRAHQVVTIQELAAKLGVAAGPPLLEALGFYGDTAELWHSLGTAE